MAEIFISYKSERRPAARHLAKVLECYGYDVWYDYGLIPGEDFEPRLMDELARAAVVIVLWCRMSVGSEWVIREAIEARRSEKYLPCRLEPTILPLEFAGADTISLIEWDGAAQSNVLYRLLGDIARRLGRDPAMSFGRFRQLDEDWRTYGAPSLAEFALGPPLKSDVSQRRDDSPARQLLGPPPANVSANLLEHWKNAQDGDSNALFAVGRAFANGTDGLHKDVLEGGRIYGIAAAHGNALAQCNLGVMYGNGSDGFPKSDVEAVRLYGLAVTQGDALAMCNLAAMHQEGRGGLPKSENAALNLYKRAADHGIARAQNNLAWMHAKGLGGLVVNQAEAARLYLAAKQGNKFAQHNIAIRYLVGHGVREDKREAALWLSKAAQQDYAPSLYKLGVMHWHGEGGITKNEPDGLELFKRAARLGEFDAQEALKHRGEVW